MSEFTQAQLVRLISQMIQIGIIVEVQAKPLRYKVQFTSDLTTNWIPSDVGHAGAVKDFAPHQEGELVLVVKEFNTQGGVIVASLNQKSHDQPKDDINLFYREFPDGTWLQYDMANKKLSGSVVGSVDIEAVSQIRLVSPKLFFVGDIEHQGKQISSGDILSKSSISAAANVSAGQNISDGVRSMSEDRKIYNNHDHPIDTPNTQKPNQKK
ncbi:hypothetical protein GCM10007938_26580 [Vibrio zhanjiangensis]|uniref:Phage baseplate assembly protein V n=1 Tax=Vibrio zhanjiangensis TaxID=1046128 RepID=A0ABQ6F0V1_9VIBR|nr:phage baseplate assembly protein V [Vibrio zhanjiangensis]GLT18876.1 hypothetical protein GCM10007938_26580 [Vibrio zhanjiangensis]